MNSVHEIVAVRPAAGRLAGWKSTAGAVSAVILSLLFLASGTWKLTDLDATAERMVQSLVPVALSMPAALAVAICETFAGVLLLIPRYRRWGAWIAGLMLVAFMIYIGVLYDRLLGEDCNCFPWIRRVVGAAFFAGDAGMVLLAVAAGWWSAKSQGWRRAALVLGCVYLVACGSYGVSAVRRNRVAAPETAIVDGRPLKLREGRVLLYFFDPECTPCLAVACEMSKRDWGSTRLVVVPTREQQFAKDFLGDAGLRAGISPGVASLRKALPFADPPYAVALDRGRVVATFNSGQMVGEDYYGTLKRLGHLN
ncbi:MAG: DoxX family protein [Bryobacteraceae bacterium]